MQFAVSVEKKKKERYFSLINYWLCRAWRRLEAKCRSRSSASWASNCRWGRRDEGGGRSFIRAVVSRTFPSFHIHLLPCGFTNCVKGRERERKNIPFLPHHNLLYMVAWSYQRKRESRRRRGKSQDNPFGWKASHLLVVNKWPNKNLLFVIAVGRQIDDCWVRKEKRKWFNVDWREWKSWREKKRANRWSQNQKQKSQ